MIKRKRIVSFALALALALCLLPAAAPAARAASFTDIADSATAEQAEVLRLLGVMEGAGNGAFRPEGTLTRAQLCKMAVIMLGKKGAAGQYQAYTIFPDVRASHWAAPYINLAVRGEERLIAGYPDGKFHPDDEITFAQTVTILMRMLGYQDSDVGAVWPQGYLAAAANLGLTDGVDLRPGDRVSRAQAARLFCNLLTTDCKSGGSYAQKLGTLKENVILMDVAATAEDGTKGAIRTQDGVIYKMASTPADASLAGRKGALLLAENGRVLTFIPDEGGTKRAVTVAEAKADGIVDGNGRKYAVPPGTEAYYRGEKTTYGALFFNLRPGNSVLLYYNGAGQVEYLFASGAAAQNAVVVGRQGSTEGFERLTDSTGYTIYKNGVEVTPAALRQYDVATYDAAANAIRVSDTRLTGYYADVSPSPAAPAKVTVLGTEFNVLPSAAADLAGFKIGEQVTLLLTEDNQVAGAADPKTVRGNAVGIATKVSPTSATVELLCGLTITGNPKLSEGNVGQYEGQLVRVTSYQKGDQISLSRVTGGGARGVLDVPGRKLGDAPLAENVRIYDKVGAGPLVQVHLSDFARTTLPADRVLYAERDYSGAVSLLVLDNGTGDGFTYGRYVFTPARYESDGDGGSTMVENAKIKVEYGGDGKTLYSEEAVCGGGYKNGDFGGLAFYKSRGGETRLAGTATVRLLSAVPNSAWNGGDSVTVRGTTYPVADDVVCYNKTTGLWVSLNQARAFADTADLYYDSVGEKIRIVVVQ